MGTSFGPAQWAVPVAFLLSGGLLGIVLEIIILPRLKRFAARTRWGLDEILVGALRGVMVWWSLTAGAYAALFSLRLVNVSLDNNLIVLLEKTLASIAILSATVFTARLAVGLVNAYARNIAGILPSTSIFSNLTRLLIFAIGVLIILQSLGVSITPILTALGVGGLAVALALQDTLSNLFSGLHLVVSRKISPGEYVRLESGEEGYVEDISWRNTTVRTIQNNLVVIPNSKLASTIITNYHRPSRDVTVLVAVGVSYDSDLEHVEQVTLGVARELLQEVPGGVHDYQPLVRYHTFGDSSINFNVVLRAREFADQYLLKHELIKRLHERYRREGIQIPFPIRTLYVKPADADSPSRV
ncbi:MAG: mechanosensitive ion channel family protein [Armatimonadetes bacterium]|nr:mechanosensitive ion channel family protein [Armatimonadota bacterium]